MRSLIDDLGSEYFDGVNDLLIELVDTTINSARTSASNEDFADYRRRLNAQYADSIYRVIMRGRKDAKSRK